MTRSKVIDLVHQTPEGEYLFSPSLPHEEMDWVEDHPVIVGPLLAERRNAAGFYTCFPAAVEQILRRSLELSIDIETTSLTRYAPAQKVDKKSHVGGKSMSAYLARYPDCTINTRPRARVLAVQTLGQFRENFVFDLDAMQPEARQRLIDTVIDGHVIIGHNVIGFDLFWLLAETNKSPKFVLDTLILVRQCKPEMLTYANFDAARADEERSATAKALIDGKSEGRVSLEYLALTLGLGKLDKTYQKPANWCVSILSPEHYQYVLSDIDVPVKILEHIFGTSDWRTINRKLRDEFPNYRHFINAAVRVATMKGAPYYEAGAAQLIIEFTEELQITVEKLKQWPEFTDDICREIADPHKGLSRIVLDAVNAHAEAHGLTLPRTEKGNVSLNRNEIKLAGLTDSLPCWSILEQATKLKKNVSTITQYRAHAAVDGRIHPLISFITAAGRTSCSEPNLQGMPRNSKLRALVAAKEFHTLVWADYSAIELRIGAVNAERAIRDIRRKLKTLDSHGDKWFYKMCSVGVKIEALPFPSDVCPDGVDEGEFQKSLPGEMIMYFAQRTLRNPVQNLVRVFRAGLDPHLVTALAMVRRMGASDIPDDVIGWLEGKTPDEQKELKERYSEQRQQAKAVNFGLLYGMRGQRLHSYGITSYGLSWTLEQAKAARDAWFELYPEIGLWHLWTKHAMSRKLAVDEVLLWNKYDKSISQSKYGAKLYTLTTLAGRPLVILDDFNQALSYQGQGSGVDILVRAIAKLPDHLMDCFFLPVHDELVFEVPADKVEEYKQDLEAVMIEAGDEVLRGLVPTEAEAKVGLVWAK